MGTHDHLLHHTRPPALGYIRPIIGRLEDERHIPESNRRPRHERSLTLDLISINEGPVRGIEIHQYPYAFATLQLRMGCGD